MLGGNRRVGGADDKNITPIGQGELPSEVEGGVVLPFTKVQFLKGDHVGS